MIQLVPTLFNKRLKAVYWMWHCRGLYNGPFNSRTELSATTPPHLCTWHGLIQYVSHYVTVYNTNTTHISVLKQFCLYNNMPLLASDLTKIYRAKRGHCFDLTVRLFVCLSLSHYYGHTPWRTVVKFGINILGKNAERILHVYKLKLSITINCSCNAIL